jgi:hypothetical protein
MEELENESKQENVVGNDNYIEALKEMKENSVAKEDYLKLKAENKQLLDTLVNGKTIETEKVKEPVNIDELRNDIFNKDLTNLDYISKTLQLREELINRGEKDPFLPYGKNILPNDEDIEKAEKVANVLQECVDIADGDADVFTNELQRRMVDPILPRKNFRR